MSSTVHSMEVKGKNENMTEKENQGQVSLEAKSPFELRINQGMKCF